MKKTMIATVLGLALLPLTFAAQTVGTTSPWQVVTVTNNGSAAMTSVTVTFTGPNAADYARAAGTCTSSLAPLFSEPV